VLLFACPAAILLVAIISRGRPHPTRAIVAELLLVVAQLFFILPNVQRTVVDMVW
jgi:hypothetical protein